MQLALSPHSADSAIASATRSGRPNKLIAAGIAVLGASAIAATPVSSSPVLLEAQHRAVDLVADVTDSTASVYEGLFTNTFSNINSLVSTYQANPLPILSQIVANQQGYVAQVGASFESAQTAFDKWWNEGTGESKVSGQVAVQTALTALGEGDFNTFYENMNKVFLFAVQNTVLPVLNGTLLGATSIPVQMAQNFTNALATTLTAGTLVYGAFQSVFAPASGAAFELSRDIQAVSTAISAGDFETALTALINTPGTVTNAFLNGFDYDGEDGATASWSGLLSSKGSCSASRCPADGTLVQFLQTIPQKIADAIANTTAGTTSVTGALSLANLFAPSAIATAESTDTEAAAGDEIVSDDAAGAEATDADDAKDAKAPVATLVKRLTAGTGVVKTAPVTEADADTTEGATTDAVKAQPDADADEAPASDAEAADKADSTSGKATDSKATDDKTTDEAKPAAGAKAPTSHRLNNRGSLRDRVQKFNDRISGNSHKPAKSESTSDSAKADSSDSDSSAGSAGSAAKHTKRDAGKKGGKHAAKKDSAKSGSDA